MGRQTPHTPHGKEANKLSTATAKARPIKPERRFTPREALLAMPYLGLDAVEEFRISLEPPRMPGDTWLAGWHGEYGYGATLTEAVADVLRQIGGGE